MIIDEEVYLEHHGVRGMRWGRRKSRETEPKEHKKLKTAAKVGAVVAIGTGAIFARQKMKALGATRVSKLQEAEHFKKVMDTGFAWKTANGPWNYSYPKNIPSNAMNAENRKVLSKTLDLRSEVSINRDAAKKLLEGRAATAEAKRKAKESLAPALKRAAKNRSHLH